MDPPSANEFGPALPGHER